MDYNVQLMSHPDVSRPKPKAQPETFSIERLTVKLQQARQEMGSNPAFTSMANVHKLNFGSIPPKLDRRYSQMGKLEEFSDEGSAFEDFRFAFADSDTVHLPLKPLAEKKLSP